MKTKRKEKLTFCPPERSQNEPRRLQDGLWTALGPLLVALGSLLAALGLLLAAFGSLLARLEPLLAALGPLFAALGSLLVALGPLWDRPGSVGSPSLETVQVRSRKVLLCISPNKGLVLLDSLPRRPNHSLTSVRFQVSKPLRYLFRHLFQ